MPWQHELHACRQEMKEQRETISDLRKQNSPRNLSLELSEMHMKYDTLTANSRYAEMQTHYLQLEKDAAQRVNGLREGCRFVNPQFTPSPPPYPPPPPPLPYPHPHPPVDVVQHNNESYVEHVRRQNEWLKDALKRAMKEARVTRGRVRSARSCSASEEGGGNQEGKESRRAESWRESGQREREVDEERGGEGRREEQYQKQGRLKKKGEEGRRGRW
eukprot:739081-Hanusia_phi.AAC.2